jgi:hypothetical protein
VIGGSTHTPGFLTGSGLAHNPLTVTGSLKRTVIVAVVARVVSVAGVAVGAWVSGEAALGRSSDVTSLRDFAVSRDPSLDCHFSGFLGLPVDQTRIQADPNALTSKSAAARWRRSDCRRSTVGADISRRRSPRRRS